jgi:hypothetical protein
MLSNITQYQRESRQAQLLNLLAQLKAKLYEHFTCSQNVNIIDRNLTSIEKQIKKL